MTRHHVMLVPGFFGFANLGDLTYFGHVADALEAAAAERGHSLHIEVVRTAPTASLRRRAGCLAEAIADTVPHNDPVHVIGHSSGGLDARLLAAPGIDIDTTADVATVAARVRTVVTVATPHRGTPLAGTLASVLGQPLLRLLSLLTIYTLRYGRLPLAVLLDVAGLVTRIDDHVGVPRGLIDELFTRVLDDFSAERRDDIATFFEAIESDQDLLPQLTPASMDVFDASTRPRADVRCGSVVAMAHAPDLLTQVAAGLDPSAQATHGIYQALYRLTGRTTPDDARAPDETQAAALRAIFGAVPTAEANDGIVPTHSQVFGDVIHGARGDHLDVLGHFADPIRDGVHVDWLASGSGFDRGAFARLWNAVLAFIIDGD